MECTFLELEGLPEGRYGAFLFDLDGTVADSMPLHLVAWQQATGEFGGSFPEEFFWAWGGVPLPRTVEMLNERLSYRLPIAEVVERKERLYLEMLDQLKPVAEVVAVLRAWQGRVPMAIVSGSPEASIEKTLGFLALRSYFTTIVGAEDYTRGKPAPEPFLVAAARMGVEARRCLVFEDAAAGIASAEAAGMDWIRVEGRRSIA